MRTLGTLSQPRSMGRSHRSERGAVIAEVLYALSIFSVLSLTAVGNSQLEATFRTNPSPDLHLILYVGGAGTPTVVGRVNPPTLSRTDPGANDQSVVLTLPALSAGPITAALSPGSTYSVQLGPSLRVCCDGADNACASVDLALPVQEATLAPAIEVPLKVSGAVREFKFNLETSEPAANSELNPAATVENGLFVKATRIADFDAVQAQASAGGYVVCRLQQGQSTLATGLLKLDAPIDALGQTSRLRGGSVHLKYLAPAETQAPPSR